MVDPVSSAVLAAGVEKGAAKLADVMFTLALAGFARAPLVDFVRQQEAAGATMDQISDKLQAMRQQSERDTQAKIDAIK